MSKGSAQIAFSRVTPMRLPSHQHILLRSHDHVQRIVFWRQCGDALAVSPPIVGLTNVGSVSGKHTYPRIKDVRAPALRIPSESAAGTPISASGCAQCTRIRKGKNVA